MRKAQRHLLIKQVIEEFPIRNTCEIFRKGERKCAKLKDIC